MVDSLKALDPYRPIREASKPLHRSEMTPRANRDQIALLQIVAYSITVSA